MRKGQQTRQKIQSAASELFALRGLDGTSVRDIAHRANVNVAQISNYFGGKEKLYNHCIAAMYAEIAELQHELLPVMGHSTTIQGAVELGIRKGFQLGRLHRDSIRMVMRHILDAGELPAQDFETIQSPFLEDVPHLLAPASTLPKEDLRWALQSLVFLIVRASLSSDEELRRFAPKHAQPKPFAEEQLVSIGLRMLGLAHPNPAQKD